LDLPEGLLIYCQHDGAAPPQRIDVRNVGTRLRTWAVRLDRTVRHIEGEMRALADTIHDAAGSHSHMNDSRQSITLPIGSATRDQG